MPALFDLVIFDNDGVLVDSEIIIKKAQKKAFNDAGFPVDDKWLYENTMGLSWAPIATNLKNSFGRTPNDNIEENVYIALDCFLSELKAIDGIIDTLKKLNVPSCIATSGNLETTLKKSMYSGLDVFFNEGNIFTSYHDKVQRGKPAPDLFIFAATHMGYNPSKCLVIEDSSSGVKGAKAAGMYVVGFTGASHSKFIHNHTELLKEAGADIVINDIRDLLEILEPNNVLKKNKGI